MIRLAVALLLLVGPHAGAAAAAELTLDPGALLTRDAVAGLIEADLRARHRRGPGGRGPLTGGRDTQLGHHPDPGGAGRSALRRTDRALPSRARGPPVVGRDRVDPDLRSGGRAPPGAGAGAGAPDRA